MYEISSEIRQKIQDASKEAESQTSAELVAVVTQKSGDYLYISVLIASVLALLFPFGILFFFFSRAMNTPFHTDHSMVI